MLFGLTDNNVNKHELVCGESSSSAPEVPDVCLSIVLLFTIFNIVVTQKLVFQQSKNVRAKCTETLSPPTSIQFSLLLQFVAISDFSFVPDPVQSLLNLTYNCHPLIYVFNLKKVPKTTIIPHFFFIHILFYFI